MKGQGAAAVAPGELGKFSGVRRCRRLSRSEDVSEARVVVHDGVPRSGPSMPAQDLMLQVRCLCLASTASSS